MSNNSLNTLLHTYLKELNADRSLVALFHQSDFESNDVVFTVMIEELSKGTKSIYPIVKNIPKNIIDLEFNSGLDSIVVVNYELGLPSKCTNHLKNIEAKTMINLLLKLNGYYWGILSFQWVNSYLNIKEKELPKALSDQLNQYRNCIHNLLENYVSHYYKERL